MARLITHHSSLFTAKLCFVCLLITYCLSPAACYAQDVRLSPDGTPIFEEDERTSGFDNDSTELTNVPEGIFVWTVDPRFGDIRPALYDTIPHGFQNENQTMGMRGHYNFTGNLNAPRISRYFSEQNPNMQTHPFIFKNPYDYFLKDTGDFLFTNTKSPFTNLTYHSCGNKTDGEDRLKAQFAVNAGKRLGIGFKADYTYGRGYYEGQSNAGFDGMLYGSYRGDKYQLHAYFRHSFVKNRENGGIENDTYVTRPENFPTSYGTADMPINLSQAQSRIDGNEFFLTHRYSVGFHRYRDPQGNIVAAPQPPKAPAAKDKAAGDSLTLTNVTDGDGQQAKAQPRIPRMPKNRPMNADGEEVDEEEEKQDTITVEFVPVTSFVHTMRIDGNERSFTSSEQNNTSDPGFFLDFFTAGDSALDRTKHLSVENTFAFMFHEGFNKWMKMGLKLYGKHEFARYRFTLPASSLSTLDSSLRGRVTKRYIENYITVGAQLSMQNSRIFRYNVLGEIRTSGDDWGEFNVEADAQLSIPMRKDSLHFDFNGFVRNERPSFYYRHYYGRNAWWDNDNLNKMLHTRINATLRYKQTALTASLENIQNYVYFQETLEPFTASENLTNYRHAVSVAQASKNIQLLAITLNQDFKWGIFHWDNEFTYQTSTNKDVFPVPAFTCYSNVYLLFHIAKVLRTEVGADVRYFTRYNAPAYSPVIGQYAVQDAAYATKIGNYPIVNVYANFHLKRTRFYIMGSHVNYSSGAGNPFLVPHYPLNRLTIHFGVSWNFIN